MRAIAVGAFAALGLTAGLGFGSGQQTAASFVRCSAGSQIRCATVTVPLDRTGAVSGTVRLAVEKVPAARKAQGVVLAVAGGPGESGTALTSSFARWLRPALETRDLVVVDLRGTGRSGFLACAVLDEACENGIPGIHSYTTRDSADDLEAVRKAIGVDRIVLYGVSYGTKVAQAYAKRYPSHVESLVLDSPVPLDGWDFYERSSYAAVDRVLGDVCGAGRCAGITADYVGDVASLAARAAAGAVELDSIGPDGARSPTPVTLTPRRLFEVVATGASFDPVIRALAPSAVHAALDGDGLPLSRLVLATAALPGRAGATFFSPVVFRATVCDEMVPAWWRNATVGERLLGLRNDLSGRDGEFAGFGADSAVAGTPSACLEWKSSPSAPAIGGSGPPDVPALVLVGADDTITPRADADAVAKAYPRAAVVTVPATGHAVLASAPSTGGCTARALSRFFDDEAVAACKPAGPIVPVTRPIPESLDRLQPWPSMAGDRGRVVRAVFRTLADVALVRQSVLLRRRGLRGGTFTVASKALALKDVVVVRGVSVRGTFEPQAGTAQLAVTVRGKATQLRLSRGVLTGRLLGRTIGVRTGNPAAAARSAP
jgi:pimeloyl-ACP methyl ester carboxylesterase